MNQNIQAMLVKVNKNGLFDFTSKTCETSVMNEDTSIINEKQLKERGKRVRKARIEAGIKTQAKLAALVGVSQQTIQQIESGHTKHSDYIERIAKICGVRASDLLYGEDENNPVTADDIPGLIHLEYKLLPVLNDNDIIELLQTGKLKDNYERTVMIMEHHLKTTSSMFGYEIVNDAMTHPTNPNVSLVIGEIAIFDKESSPKSGDVVMTLTEPGNIKIRQLMIDGADYLLKAYNDSYPRINIDTKTTKIMGSLVGIQPKTKIIKQMSAE